MAMMLKVRHHLLALKVTYRFWLPEPDVVLELERLEKDGNTLQNRWEIKAAELGALEPMDCDQPALPNLRDAVLSPLADMVQQEAVDDEPLWLHLVQPYGALGSLDWEGVLAPRLGRAVLRLPDFIERPHENRSTLTVALICDLPTDEPRFDLIGSVVRIARAMASASPRRVTDIHIFAGMAWSPRIEDALKTDPPKEPWYDFSRTPRIVVHHAQDEGQGPLTWLDWIERSMNGQGVDHVHFVTHACLVEHRPALALTASPLSSQKLPTAQFVMADDLARALTRTGAWACGFATPPDTPGAILRFFADTLAQARPGPVLNHRIDDDAALQQFEQWFRFLFAPDPGDPPPGAQGLVYCQPTLVAGYEPLLPDQTSVPAMVQHTLLDNIADFVKPGNEPQWVAAAQRFAESAALQGQRWASVDPLTGAPDQRSAPQQVTAGAASEAPPQIDGSLFDAAALDDTLMDLHRIVSAHARDETSS